MSAADRQEIADLVHRYADAVCRHDEAQWAACWADDAVWALAPGREPEGKEAIVELWKGAMAGFTMAIQMVHNGAVEVDGDRATGRWYIAEHLLQADGVARRFLAWYDDEYVRTADGWRFARRAAQALYAGPPDLVAEGFITPG